MKSITEIITESSNVTSNINWLDFTDENLNSVFKEIVEICEADHKKRYKVNILVIANEKKTKVESDQFKGKYKLMSSEVECYWSDNSNITNGVSKVNFWPKNISSPAIIKFVPMEMALPKEFQK